MLNIQKPTCLQRVHQQYRSVEIWGVTNEISGSNNTVHPYISYPPTSPMHSPRQELHIMPENHSNFPGKESQGKCSSTAHFRRWMRDDSLPVLIELRDIFLCEDDLRTIYYLGGRQDPRYFENTCIDQEVQELAWLHNEKRRLAENLDDLQFQLRNLGEIGCLEINKVFVTGTNEHDEAALLPLTARPGAYHLDESKSIGAKKQLGENEDSKAKIELGPLQQAVGEYTRTSCRSTGFIINANVISHTVAKRVAHSHTPVPNRAQLE